MRAKRSASATGWRGSSMFERAVGEYRFSHPSIALRWAGATDPGRVRTVNEDSVFASFPVFLVADGMGGHAAGDIASALAVESFRALKGRALADIEGVEAAIDRAFRVVHRETHGQTPGGTTLTGAVLVDIGGVAHWFVLNIGDSRTYLMSDGALRQVSVDHSVVQELVEAGTVHASQARTHPDRHVITRAIGAGTLRGPDCWLLPAERGHRLVVCSDGLTAELDDAEIEHVLRAAYEPARAAGELVERALNVGGRDNISVVVADVIDVASDGFDVTWARDIEDTVPRRRNV